MIVYTLESRLHPYRVFDYRNWRDENPNAEWKYLTENIRRLPRTIYERYRKDEVNYDAKRKKYTWNYRQKESTVTLNVSKPKSLLPTICCPSITDYSPLINVLLSILHTHIHTNNTYSVSNVMNSYQTSFQLKISYISSSLYIMLLIVFVVWIRVLENFSRSLVVDTLNISFFGCFVVK